MRGGGKGGVCGLKTYPKTKVHAKYQVNISTGVVSTPYPYLSIIWFNRGREEPSPLPFGEGFKSFQLGIIKYVKTGDFLPKTRSLYPILKA